MPCSICASIPTEISGHFLAKATFEAAENFAQNLVATGAWQVPQTVSGFEAIFSCSACGAQFHLVMPGPPISGGLFRVSPGLQRTNQIREKRQRL